MLDKPKVVQTQVQPTAVFRLTVPRAEIQSVMGPAIAEVMAVASAQGFGSAGPVFSRHFRMDAEVFDFEVGVPVAGLVSETGRVKASQLPAATVARTIYRGPYEGLGAAWKWDGSPARRVAARSTMAGVGCLGSGRRGWPPV